MDACGGRGEQMGVFRDIDALRGRARARGTGGEHEGDAIVTLKAGVVRREEKSSATRPSSSCT